jgi:UDP-3-O-[3-hydroxymyristoyl] glucosamine N-acyltransferase
MAQQGAEETRIQQGTRIQQETRIQQGMRIREETRIQQETRARGNRARRHPGGGSSLRE